MTTCSSHGSVNLWPEMLFHGTPEEDRSARGKQIKVEKPEISAALRHLIRRGIGCAKKSTNEDAALLHDYFFGSGKFYTGRAVIVEPRR